MTKYLTVGDLIERLRALPPDMPVVAQAYDWSCLDVVDVAVTTFDASPSVAVLATDDDPLLAPYYVGERWQPIIPHVELKPSTQTLGPLSPEVEETMRKQLKERANG